MTPADLTVLLDWLTDQIAAMEAQDVLYAAELTVLVWLRAKRRALNAALLNAEDGA